MIPEALDGKNGINGWFGFDEAQYICECIRSLTVEGCVVELGSWRGKSTVQIAHECKLANREFIAIDNFQKIDSNKELLMNNLIKYDVANYCQFLQNDTRDFIGKWNKPIALLFNDARHDYEGVKEDLEIFLPWVVSNGFILFHDYSRAHDAVKEAARIMGLEKPLALAGSVAGFRNNEIKSEDVTIVIKTFNRLELFKQVFEKLPYNWPKIIIDDNSTDGTKEFLANKNLCVRSRFNDIEAIITNKQNIGGGNCCNLGTKMAKTPYVWHIDNDLIHKEEVWPLILKSLNIMKGFNCLVGLYIQRTQRWRDHHHDKVYITRDSRPFNIHNQDMILGDINSGSFGGRKSLFNHIGDIKPNWGYDREYITRCYESDVFLCAPSGSLGFVKDIGKKTNPTEVGEMKRIGAANLEKWKDHDENVINNKKRKVEIFFNKIDKLLRLK